MEDSSRNVVSETEISTLITLCDNNTFFKVRTEEGNRPKLVEDSVGKVNFQPGSQIIINFTENYNKIALL